jgi:hypothetical protein
MLRAIWYKLVSLYQNGQSEFRKTPLQASAALVVIGGIFFQIIVAIWPRVSSSNPIIVALQENTKINMPLLTLSLGLLAWSFLRIRISVNKFATALKTIQDNEAAIDVFQNQALASRERITALESEKQVIKSDADYYSAQSDDLRIKYNELMAKLSEYENATPTKEYDTRYRIIGDYKWKVQIYPSGHIALDPYPFCAKHDLKLISQNGKPGKSCPDTDCKNAISEYDDYGIRETARSYIEKELRNNDTSSFTTS